MNTDLIRMLLADLDKAKTALETAKADLNLMSLSGHQTSISVHVGNRSYPLSFLNRETGWMSKLIRGREMIMLGAKKGVMAEVEHLTDEVHAIERKLAGEMQP